MQSTLTPQDTDPHDVFVIEPDVVLAARQASPDPVQELLSHLAHRAAERSPEASGFRCRTDACGRYANGRYDVSRRCHRQNRHDRQARGPGRPAGDQLVGEARFHRLHVRALQRVRCRSLDASWCGGQTDDLKLAAAVRAGGIACERQARGRHACCRRATGLSAGSGRGGRSGAGATGLCRPSQRIAPHRLQPPRLRNRRRRRSRRRPSRWRAI